VRRRFDLGGPRDRVASLDARLGPGVGVAAALYFLYKLIDSKHHHDRAWRELVRRSGSSTAGSPPTPRFQRRAVRILPAQGRHFQAIGRAAGRSRASMRPRRHSVGPDRRRRSRAAATGKGRTIATVRMRTWSSDINPDNFLRHVADASLTDPRWAPGRRPALVPLVNVRTSLIHTQALISMPCQ